MFHLIVEMRKCQGNVWGNWFPITFEGQMPDSKITEYLKTCEEQKGNDENREYRIVAKK